MRIILPLVNRSFFVFFGISFLFAAILAVTFSVILYMADSLYGIQAVRILMVIPIIFIVGSMVIATIMFIYRPKPIELDESKID